MKFLVRLSLALLLGLAVYQAFSLVHAFATKKPVGSTKAKAPQMEFARLGNEGSVRAANLGKAYFDMADGRDLLTAYSGIDEQAQRLLENNQAAPLALTTGEFNEDWIPDLLSAYASESGGILTIHKGNVDSIHPNAAEARQRKAAGLFTNAPFLSPARVFTLPAKPDFIEVGDFDADGHNDVVTAQRDDATIYFLRGHGNGELDMAQAIVVAGRITAFASGDVNRADNLTDLAVAIDRADGAKLLVFEHYAGAIKATPEEMPLPAVATALTVGFLDNDAMGDVIAGAGRKLLIIGGRDRKLTLEEWQRAAVPPATIFEQDFAAEVTSVAIGEFVGDLQSELGVLTADGAIELISPKRTKKQLYWQRETLTSEAGASRGKLTRARLSGLLHETLVMTDATNQRIRVWRDDEERRQRGDVTLQAVTSERNDPVSIAVEGEPVATLPMFLNNDGISDLVVLQKGHTAPIIVNSVSATIIVTTAQDCTSCPGGGVSLRNAIGQANSNSSNSNVILFSSSAFDNIPTITLTNGSLPSATKALTLDGAQDDGNNDVREENVVPQSLQAIQLTSNNNPASVPNALRVANTGGVVLKNFIVNRVTIGVEIANGSGNRVEAMKIGTNSSGSAVSANTGRGVFVNNSRDNDIGVRAVNTISGNAVGVEISGANANDTRVQLNLIGTNSNNSNLGNTSNGVIIANGASRTLIGGFINNIGLVSNIIQANSVGVAVTSGTGTIIQGSALISNRSHGVSLNSSGNGVGGIRQQTNSGVRNLFFQNQGSGIEISGASASSNLVQGNYIGMDFSATSIGTNFGNQQHGISVSASNNSIGGAAPALGNVIAFNLLDGVSVLSGTGNQIRSNDIFSNGGLGIDLGNDGFTPNDSGDGDSGANNLQNFPELAAVTVTSTAAITDENVVPQAAVTITGVMNSIPNTTYDLHFYYCSQACGSGGVQHVNCRPTELFNGATLDQRTPNLVTTNANGLFNFSFAFQLPNNASTGFINATATRQNTADTSELSPCNQIGACTFQANPTAQTVPAAAGGPFNFAVNATAGCNWTASRGANDWITITSGSGTGNGTVTFTVAANASTNSRNGAITVGTATHTVTQSGATNCTYQINPNGANFGAAGGSGSFAITTQTGCQWTANASDNWITVNANGTGNGNIGYTVAANSSTNQRTGFIFAGGQTYTITQSGAAAGPTITNAFREGKHLFVIGSGFQEGAKVFRNGEQIKTAVELSTRLFCKKQGKSSVTGDQIQVRNPDGSLSNVVSYPFNAPPVVP